MALHGVLPPLSDKDRGNAAAAVRRDISTAKCDKAPFPC